MKYLTAKQLNITQKERTALIAVRRFIAKLKRPKKLGSEDQYASLRKPAAAKFYMASPVAKFDCGTAMCIGGWMSAKMQGIRLKRTIRLTEKQVESARRYVFRYKDDGALQRLFFSDRTSQTLTQLTPARAVKEITRFLTTGKVSW